MRQLHCLSRFVRWPCSRTLASFLGIRALSAERQFPQGTGHAALDRKAWAIFWSITDMG